jgi:ribonuclease HI
LATTRNYPQGKEGVKSTLPPAGTCIDCRGPAPAGHFWCPACWVAVQADQRRRLHWEAANADPRPDLEADGSLWVLLLGHAAAEAPELLWWLRESRRQGATVREHDGRWVLRGWGEGWPEWREAHLRAHAARLCELLALLPAPEGASMQELYCDGGVIGRNPSAEGGVWAWCRVEGETRVAEGSGVVRPAELGVAEVTNNNTELLALLEGIEALPEGQCVVRVNSDSQIALGWVFSGWSQEKIPAGLRERLNALRSSGRLAGLSWRLLQGHPTKADLAAGIGAKRGLPVSPWNVWCDKTCQALAKEASHA